MPLTKEERELTDRVRAHVRQHMVDWELNDTSLTAKLEANLSSVHRVMKLHSRAAPLWFLEKVHTKLGIKWEDLLASNPPREFWSDACLTDFKYRRTGDQPNPSEASGSSQPRGRTKAAR